MVDPALEHQLILPALLRGPDAEGSNQAAQIYWNLKRQIIELTLLQVAK